MRRADLVTGVSGSRRRFFYSAAAGVLAVGLVRRLPGPPVLSEKQIGESAGPAAQATAAGTGAGQNLAGAGLNVNLAPVLDVYRTPDSFDDQFQRSYSMNPQTVADLGADFITAQQATGVAATAKHFPGLGTATGTPGHRPAPGDLDRAADRVAHHR